LWSSSGEIVDYYNAMLNVINDDFESKKDLEIKNYISKYELQKQFSAKRLGLKPTCLMSCQVNGIADSLFNSIKGFYQLRKTDSTAQFPKQFKSRRFFHPLYFSFSPGAKNLKIVDKNILELTFQGRRKILIKCKYNKLKDLTKLKFTNDGHKLIYDSIKKSFYFHFCYKSELKIADSSTSIFIDLGQKTLVTGFIPETNEIIKVSGKPLKSPILTKRIEEIQSKKDLKKKGSRFFKRLKRTQDRLKRTETNSKRTFLHRVSKQLVTNHHTVVVGDLKGIKKNTKSKIKNINKYKNQMWPVSLFVKMLNYKSKLYSGNKFYKIDESNTTKNCCNCGTSKVMTLSDRTYNCNNCKLVLERDTNSAINIYHKFYKQLDPKLSSTNLKVQLEALTTKFVKVN